MVATFLHTSLVIAQFRSFRTSFFLIGFYSLSLVCLVLIVKFGILPAVNPPSNTLQGMFVLACSIAGIMGGAFTIFFWKATKYFIGAWGGFAFGLWIQCFRNGGLIPSVGLRWILYIGMFWTHFPLHSRLNLLSSVWCRRLCALHHTKAPLAYATSSNRFRWFISLHSWRRLLYHCWTQGSMSRLLGSAVFLGRSHIRLVLRMELGI